MAADVVEGADRAVLVLDDDDAALRPGELLGEVAADARELLDAPDVEPFLLEDRVDLLLPELGVVGVLVRTPAPCRGPGSARSSCLLRASGIWPWRALLVIDRRSAWADDEVSDLGEYHFRSDRRKPEIEHVDTTCTRTRGSLLAGVRSRSGCRSSSVPGGGVEERLHPLGGVGRRARPTTAPPCSITTTRSHSSSACETCCSMTSSAVPAACSCASDSYVRSTIVGASPSESSSAISSFGASTNTRAIASIRCSPPDSVPATWSRRSSRRGNSSKASSRPARHALAAADPVDRQDEVLLDRECAEHRATLRSVGDAGAGELVRRLAGQVDAVDADRAGRRGDQPGCDTRDRRLAGAVRADEGDRFSRFDRERHVEQGAERAVVRIDVAQLECGAHAGTSRSPR